MSSFAPLLQVAWERRRALLENPSLTCYRVFHGYSEGVGGLSIERFGDTAIIQKKAEHPYGNDEVREALLTHYPFSTIVQKVHQRLDVSTSQRVELLHGLFPDAPPVVEEEGVRFHYNPRDLHTNGLFLDARSTRQWIRVHGKDRRVLNLFAHTGSLGLVADLGGAKEVVHLDKSRVNFEGIQANYALNGIAPSSRGLLRGDLYFHLPRAVRSGQKFDAIILDPPPKVPRPPKAPKHRPVGQDFAHLIRLCCDLLAPKGWLLCLYHRHALSHDEHDAAITSYAEGRLSSFWRDTSGEDFPENDPDQKTRVTAFEYSEG